jgi:hypothetical protein
MHGPINVNSPNNTSKWQMGFNSAFKGLTTRWSAVAREPAVLGRCFPFKKGHGLKTKRPRAHVYIELFQKHSVYC